MWHGVGLLAAMALGQFNTPLSRSPLTVPEGMPEMWKLTFVVHAYANFAPDNKTVVFQSNANGNWDLYTIRLDGEELNLIVSDGAADITPVFSPDGKTIVFVSERDGNREVYLCDADGRNQRRLTNDSGHDLHPVFSPDGKKIMFSSNRLNLHPEDYDIYVMNVDGTGVKQLTDGPEIDTYASWSPDGKRIITRRVIDGANNEVFLLDADGKNPVNLTNLPNSYDGWPVWAPDSMHIAYSFGPAGAAPHRIMLMNVDTGELKPLTDAPPGMAYVYDTQPSFSHDGQRLIFTRYRPGPKESAELCIIEKPLLG